MNIGTERVSPFLGIVTLLASNVGCATLPWRAHKPAATMTAAEQYAQQAVENISYDNSVGFTQDYQPSPTPASSYTPPPKSFSTAASSASGGCATGCCH